MKKSVLWGLVCIMLSLSVAASFDIDVIALKDTISLDDAAQFRIVITNTDDVDQKFRIFNDFVEWDIYTIPRSDSTVSISKGGSKTVFVEARPLSPTIREGYYFQVPLRVSSITNSDLQTVILPIGVRSQEFIESIYSPRIDVKLTLDREVDPREDMQINVELINRNPRNFSMLMIDLNSDLIQQQKVVSLAPYQTKVVPFTVSFDDLQEPKKDMLNLHVLLNNSQGKSIIVSKQESMYFEIIGYGVITDAVESTKSFLKRTTIITLTNDANKQNQQLYKVPAPFYRILQHAEPKPTIIKEDRNTYYAWDVSLAAQETYPITIITNLRILFYLFIMAVVMILGYYFFRSPLVITKTASNVIMREGGVTEMKILISLKNRGYRVIEDIQVTDRVPQVADIKKEFEVGTLQPSRVVKHEHKGTIVKWDLDGLESFEERILSYTIASKLSILGEFKLPVTHATFKQYHRRRKTKSNRYLVKNLG